MTKAYHAPKHLERGQPYARLQKHSLLEKKKDYKLRAKDYHLKQKRIKALTEKAKSKNEDEFYWGMIRSKIRNDGTQELKTSYRNRLDPNIADPDTIKKFKSQDLNFIRMYSQKEKKKLEKMIAKGEISAQDLSDARGEIDSAGVFQHGKLGSKPKHTIFMDDDAFEKCLNESNFPISEVSSFDKTSSNPKSKKILESSFKRREILDKSLKNLETQKLLLTQKGKRWRVDDGNGGYIYKWRAERSK